MTRRRFYAPPCAFALDTKSATLAAEEARHAREVLRLRRGDEVYVFDGKGREFRCAIREFTRDEAVLEVIEEVEPTRPESPLKLALGIALLKHDKLDLVIQKATELGVTRIIPVKSERADVHLRNEDDATRRVTRWRRIALEAVKQSGRARLPEISAPLEFESLIQESFGNDALRVMLAERGGNSLSTAVKETDARHIVALVGPEGGWSDGEIELARESDWRVVTLGGRTLRAETATIAVIALLQHQSGDLD